MKTGNTTLSAYSYDGLGHRITETPAANVSSGSKTDLFYSAQWQVIEEDTHDSGLTLQTHNVWSPVYVNALIFRDYDFNADGVFEITDRTYAMQDANYNITTLLDYDNHTLIGDLNTDLHVNDLDQTLLLANWQQSVTAGTNGDLNNDGFVDISDLTLLANHFGDSDGFKAVEHFAYSAYGIATTYDASWTTTSDTLDWNYLFQGGRLDKSTGDINFENRDYNPRTMTWNTKDPLGYVNGPDVYQFVGDGPINFVDPNGLYLVAFDGTWDQPPRAGNPVGNGNNGRETIIYQFYERYMQKGDYVRGVGNNTDNPKTFNQLVGGAFGAGASKAVDAAYTRLAQVYNDNANPGDREIDIIGYSRGGFQALKLAQLINDLGIPDFSSGHTVVNGEVKFCKAFHPKIRFLGLVDPVAQFNVPSTPITPINNETSGWPTQAPGNVNNMIELWAANNDDPIFPHHWIPGSGTTGNMNAAIFPDTHGEIGGDDIALQRLIAAAKAAGAPVK